MNAQPNASIIVSGALEHGSADHADLTLRFSGPIPRCNVPPQAASAIVVQCIQTRIAPQFRPIAVAGALVESVRVNLIGGDLNILILVAVPAHVDFSATANTIELSISRDRSPPSKQEAMRRLPIVLGATTAVVILHFADVSEIAGALIEGQTVPVNDTFAPQPSQISQSASSIGGASGGIVAAQSISVASPASTQALGQKLTDELAIDRRLNAIILTGTPERVAELRSLIAQLDVPLPTVTLETQIVELTDSAAKQVGIDYTNAGGPIAAVSTQLKSQSLATSSLNLQAQIYDVVTKGGGKLLARPSIVAQSGSPASILTGDEIPVVTTLTSFGSATLTQQQVQYVTVGVNLQIQPRVSPDGFINFHIYSEVSSVSSYVQGYPEITQRTATTAATVRDGQSFVIGGLIEDSEINSLSKIPLLGDLPLLGSFFRNRTEQRVNTNLYIVVTPHITNAPSPDQSHS
ncbi:MAG TPA: secretin N-terminal domain-containing protein [Candidatus Sulfotelmatobacter sp.]|nr:secretin N-terminal domain-containing protein [Candidatus Sulfotelmatobacter sp.]